MHPLSVAGLGMTTVLLYHFIYKQAIYLYHFILLLRKRSHQPPG